MTFSELVEPVAFREGDLFTLAFPGLGYPIVDIKEGMFVEDCRSSHLPSNFFIASKVDESIGALFNILVVPASKGRNSPGLPEIVGLKKISTCCLPGLVERSLVGLFAPLKHCFVDFEEGFGEFLVLRDTFVSCNFAWVRVAGDVIIS